MILELLIGIALGISLLNFVLGIYLLFEVNDIKKRQAGL